MSIVAVRKRVIEWRVRAVVEDDSVAFAARLEKLLNDTTAEGFAVQSLMVREPDQGLVVTFFRALGDDIMDEPNDPKVMGPTAN